MNIGFAVLMFSGGDFLGSKNKEKPTQIKEKHTLLSEHRVCNYHVFKKKTKRERKGKETAAAATLRTTANGNKNNNGNTKNSNSNSSNIG